MCALTLHLTYSKIVTFIFFTHGAKPYGLRPIDQPSRVVLNQSSTLVRPNRITESQQMRHVRILESIQPNRPSVLTNQRHNIGTGPPVQGLRFRECSFPARFFLAGINCRSQAMRQNLSLFDRLPQKFMARPMQYWPSVAVHVSAPPPRTSGKPIAQTIQRFRRTIAPFISKTPLKRVPFIKGRKRDEFKT